ncbi:uncharacterized protein N7484_009556 [Penicillium longicatenatum]|uniref:uncharacterized protein n=1 Tax=Penicillium longicatenatum TaxID=1561947 RepID=UPI0025499165|nr:uncharacterized protein N7484_009556 [Penicillium longicatenatum]KAJ5636243.1 hypothetical protein N7484_009556 [Penicillium longicatenatum]
MHDQAIVPQQPHLEIFNSLLEGPPKDQTFHLFPFLPPEIRFIIWESALQRRRIIRVNFMIIDTAKFNDGILDYNESYIVALHGCQVFSKLFRVNRESREIAQAFYRAQFPCMFVNVAGDKVSSTCYINPDFDTIQFDINGLLTGAFIDFLYVLRKDCDPFQVGLLSLALDKPSLLNIHRFITQNYATIASLGTANLFQILLFNFASFTLLARNRLARSSTTAATCTFALLSQDPRSIQQDLTHQYLGEDPREMVIAWRETLRILEICPIKINYQLLLAFQPPSRVQISNCKSAADWLRSEDAEWRGEWRLGNEIRNGNWALRYWEYTDRLDECEIGALHERNHDENLEKAVKPAFGFWLFPLKTICNWPDNTTDEVWAWPEICSLAHEWPALALSSLP